MATPVSAGGSEASASSSQQEGAASGGVEQEPSSSLPPQSAPEQSSETGESSSGASLPAEEAVGEELPESGNTETTPPAEGGDTAVPGKEAEKAGENPDGGGDEPIEQAASEPEEIEAEVAEPEKDEPEEPEKTVFEGSAEGMAIEVKIMTGEPEVVPEDAVVNAAQVPVVTPAGEAVPAKEAATAEDVFYQTMITEDALVLDVSGESEPVQDTVISTDDLAQMAAGEPELLPANMAAVPLDISLSVDGEEIQPDGPVDVSVQIPAGMEPANAAVYYVPEQGTPEKMPGQVVGGCYVFTTTHFTRYTLVSSTITSGTKLTSEDVGKTLTGGIVYYVDSDTTIGASYMPMLVNGLRVNGTDSAHPAVLYIPYGVTLTVAGGEGKYNVHGSWGRAGIYLPAAQYLYVRGAGTLDVNGGAGQNAMQGSQSYPGSISTKTSSGAWMSGSGGAGGKGGTGSGAGIGTNGAGGGVGGKYVGESVFSPVNANTVGSGKTGNVGTSGDSSEDAGTLYILDTIVVNARGGAASESGQSGSVSGNADDKGSGWDNSYFVGAGGGGGGGGGGGAGAGIGSGGAGGGGGGAGGTGGRTMNTGTYGTPSSYPTGGGGSGGGGASDGGTGAGSKKLTGGAGGAAGTAGVAGSGGFLYIASTAFCSNYGGKGANGQAAVLNRGTQNDRWNSLYTITLDENKPSASATVSAPYNTINLQAGIVPTLNGKYTASSPGWEFLGWYSAKTGGVKVIDAYGYFSSDATGYTNATGGWVYGDDATLYARWKAGIYQVVLSNQGATNPGTASIYLKYDSGWYATQNANGSPLSSIKAPAKYGYDFKGYYTDIGGNGTEMVDEDGVISAGKTAITENSYLYAHWAATPYTATLTLTRDDSAYTGVPVQLFQYGYLKYTLAESGSTGVYANSDVITGNYQVYVDGRNTGRSLAVNAADKSETLAFRGYTLTTLLDGSPSPTGTATLRQNGTVYYTMAYLGGQYTAAVLEDADTAFDVYIGSESIGMQMDAGNRAQNANYYTAALQLTYDSLWTDAQVTLWQNGRLKHSLAYDAGKDNVKTTTYSKIVYCNEAPGANNVYDVYIDGRDTGKNINISQSGFEAVPKQTIAADAYYKATVRVEKDGAAWATGASVQLAYAGSSRYTLSYDENNQLYSWDYVQISGDGTEAEYDVRVLGSVSGSGTGLKVKSDNAAVSVAYFTVTYKMVADKGLPTEAESDYLVQVVRKDEAAPKPPDPYTKGVGFSGWFQSDGSGGYLPGPFNFGTGIISQVTLHALFEVPGTAINGYMRCHEDGAMASDGRYYRMVNFTLGGYPAEETGMLMMTLTSANGSVKVKGSLPAGCAVYNNINADGNGTLTLTCGSGIKPAQLESFVRDQLLVKVEDGAQTHTMAISVFGTV